MTSTPNLDSITKSSKELSSLRQLLKATKQQIDDSVEQGNNALLDLQAEYEELAEKKRELLREIEKLEEKRDRLQGKMHEAESIYADYLDAIRSKRQ